MKTAPKARIKWPTRRLGDVLIRHNEIIHPGDRKGEATFVGLEHIEPNTGNRIGSLTIDLGKLTGRKPTFRRGQIVYGYLRPYLNKVWIADFDGCSSVDQFAFAVRPDLADANFIAAFMRSDTFLRRSRTGTTPGQLPRINVDEIAAVPIGLPPIADQRRIAAGLLKALAVLDTARRAAEARLAAAEVLPAGYLREVFERSPAQHWPRFSVNELRASGAILEHQDGNHGELHPRKTNFVDAGVRFVTAKHLRPNGDLDLDKAPFISCEQAEGLRIGFAHANDILLAHNASVGPVGKASEDCEPFVVGTSLTIYRANQPVMDPTFLFMALRSEDFQRQLLDAMKQTTRNQVPITRQRELRLPLPPVADQRSLAAKLAELLVGTDTLVGHCRDELAMLDAMPGALLRSAFNGES